MTYIYVDKSKFRNFSGKCGKISKNLNNIKSEFNSTASSLDWEIKDSAGIDRKIRNLNNDLQERIGKFRRMQTFLEYAYGEYDKLDSQSLKMLESIEGASKTTKGNSSVVNWAASSLNQVKDFALNCGFKTLKKVKFVGPIVSSVEKVYKRVTEGKTYGGFSNDTFLGLLGNSAAVAKDGVSMYNDWGKFKDALVQPTGGKLLQKPTDIFKGKGFWDTLKTNTGIKGGNVDIGKLKGVNPAKFIGYALDAGLTIGENLTNEESKNQSTLRNLSEGALESAIKIGKGVLISSAVAATIGLTGPGLLVATAGATLLVDGVLNTATNKVVSAIKKEEYNEGFVECVSDTILDAIGSGIDAAASLGNHLKEVVGGTYKNATYNTRMQYT